MKQLPIEQLQQDVLRFLNGVSSFVTHIGNMVDFNEAKNGKCTAIKTRINEEIEKITHLQLRMAVVAPMKAGKSTIINAIAGQELLPSRNTAMTVLPTEITFNPNLDKPYLELNNDILAVFENILDILQKRLQELKTNNEPLDELEKMDYLKTLAERIRTGQYTFPRQNKITERQDIYKTLETMNDIVRLYGIVAPDSEVDVFKKFDTIPRIHAPVLHLKNAKTSEKMGNLIVIDTPGENESANLNLSDVVQVQLEKSSIVLLVLDFTQLNNQAAENIRQKVQNIVNHRGNERGKEHLYVLVNKIDQRNEEKDMTPEEVRQFVTVQFGIKDDEDRVFEVAAKQAFCATNFLLEVRECPNLDVTEMNTSRALAKEVLRGRWESKLAQSSIGELSEEAGYLWDDSGFKMFLEKAIYTLMLQVAPKCLQSALNFANNSLSLLLHDLEERKEMLPVEQGKIQEQLQALEEDLKQLQELQKPWEADIMEYKEELQTRLRKQIKSAKKQAKIQDMKSEEMTEFRRFFHKLCEEFEVGEENTSFQFLSKYHAQEFSNRIIRFFEGYVKAEIADLRLTTMREIQSTNDRLRQNFLSKTGQLIKQAEERLHKTIHIGIKMPKPEWPSVKPDIEDIVESKQHNENIWKWVYVWKIPFRIPLWVTKIKMFYMVSLNNLYDKINESVASNFEKIEASLRIYLDQNFEARMREFFDSVRKYFEAYYNTLESALNDHKLEGEKKARLSRDLDTFIPQIKAQIQDAERHLASVSEIMRQQHGK